MDAVTLPPGANDYIQRGSVVALFWMYTGAVGVSAFSSSCGEQATHTRMHTSCSVYSL